VGKAQGLGGHGWKGSDKNNHDATLKSMHNIISAWVPNSTSSISFMIIMMIHQWKNNAMVPLTVPIKL
jgi:hypothetical protein